MCVMSSQFFVREHAKSRLLHETHICRAARERRNRVFCTRHIVVALLLVRHTASQSSFHDAEELEGQLLTAITARASLMRDVAAAKAARGSTCAYDADREFAVLKAAKQMAAKAALPVAQSLLLAQVQADCAKQIEHHFLEAWDADPPEPTQTLEELRQQLVSLNAEIAFKWSIVREYWHGDTCASLRRRLRQRLAELLGDHGSFGRCAEEEYQSMLVFALSSVASACSNVAYGDAYDQFDYDEVETERAFEYHYERS